ncbi:MAG: hypothetical protein LBK61_02795 [Spirochaetaceae bacterium]|nr:hypothetical protein [Spirochaetaceae bacterium]
MCSKNQPEAANPVFFAANRRSGGETGQFCREICVKKGGYGQWTGRDMR